MAKKKATISPGEKKMSDKKRREKELIATIKYYDKKTQAEGKQLMESVPIGGVGAAKAVAKAAKGSKALKRVARELKRAKRAATGVTKKEMSSARKHASLRREAQKMYIKALDKEAGELKTFAHKLNVHHKKAVDEAVSLNRYRRAKSKVAKARLIKAGKKAAKYGAAAAGAAGAAAAALKGKKKKKKAK